MLAFFTKISRLLYDLLVEQGVEHHKAALINVSVNTIVLILLLLLIDRLLRKIVVTGFFIFSKRTKTSYDNYLFKGNFPKYIAHILPFIALYFYIPIIFQDFEKLQKFIQKVTDVYLIILVVWICRSMVKATRDFLKSQKTYKDKPLDSFAQVIIMMIWAIGLVFIYSEIFEKPLGDFITTLGAASALIILLFRDTILGFVASIQVAINDMVRIDDWITMEKFGADGTVIEINLTTVKVQNFDYTITTIPTYRLISDSFKNWRGMQNSGGRRIKRSIFIKVGSIQFLTEDLLNKYRKIGSIADYIDHRQEDIRNHNQTNNVDKSLLVNGRNQTNLGLFRKYVENYLNKHPAIHSNMIIMVRQLQPTTQGVPVEVYAFSKDKNWVNYEHIMADIFDHIFAAVPYFDLECFELPSAEEGLVGE
ncbi:MAG: mechanosensitive ion channel family protein [Flavobacteriaceae bacterium]|nr:mechanosensitive ion channel family protein [Flavobacteriaceae bacterium]